ncbi:hypothetical protein A2714_01695 [Candidatus Woesebacteria bacterium RIFCSPHIGHO2_01_FULL_38_9]|uniref:Uncharacterized protein n=2 Tax=Candidatus Woeseibacteriota TaxID=1752722 RepID=A0A1F7XZM5_9BACT|nr:MAG: hypothetical protein A2714_01695 [Candidatus Woesebacteria bacterium RIFCSPHIGHO2_01_FULL_38_9]OGM59359.1 MAG: hypothetical protein A3A75_03340 [Candidatus Woesebacteria bacterium RIFCSPLOWO2_01_FULL_39_10]
MHEICQEIANAKIEDVISAKDFYLRIEGKDYIITVTSPEHAHLYNEGQEEQQTAFIVGDLSDPVKICQTLSETPFEQLRPFLTMQEES